MSKIVECKVKGFEGKVTLYQPLTLDQVFAFEEAQDAATELEPSKLLTKVNEQRGLKTEAGDIVKGFWSSRSAKFFIPVIVKCVEKFEIEGLPQPLTVENFPMTPRTKSQEFIDFLMGEISGVYSGEVEIPNES